MKKIIRAILSVASGLYITSWLSPGFMLPKDMISIFTIIIALVLANWFIKPIFKIIFMPLNIATFGLFSIVINALILYGVVYFFNGIVISSWDYNGFNYNGFIVPKIHFGIILTYLFSGMIISIVTTVTSWLVNE